MIKREVLKKVKNAFKEDLEATQISIWHPRGSKDVCDLCRDNRMNLRRVFVVYHLSFWMDMAVEMDTLTSHEIRHVFTLRKRKLDKKISDLKNYIMEVEK